MVGIQRQHCTEHVKENMGKERGEPLLKIAAPKMLFPPERERERDRQTDGERDMKTIRLRE